MQLREQFIFGYHINKSMIDQVTNIKIAKTSHGFVLQLDIDCTNTY